MCWSAIGRAKLMMIGSPTPTVAPLTGLKVGGTNGGAPVNGSGFWPTTGPVGAATEVAGAPAAGVAGGTAGAGADGAPGDGGGAAGVGGGGTASGAPAGGGGARGGRGGGRVGGRRHRERDAGGSRRRRVAWRRRSRGVYCWRRRGRGLRVGERNTAAQHERSCHSHCGARSGQRTRGPTRHLYPSKSRSQPSMQ